MAKQRKSRSEWLQTATHHHQDRYDYTQVPEEITAASKVVITCRIHGGFEQSMSAHTRGQGCPSCATQNRAQAQRVSKEQFLAKAHKVFGEAYDYTLMNFTNMSSKISIVCNSHGAFSLTPKRHLTGVGCPTCDEEKVGIFTNNEAFLKEVKKLHKNTYSYSMPPAGKHLPLKVFCKAHGGFTTTPYKHLKGDGCPSCGMLKGGRMPKGSREAFILKAQNKHGAKYDYSKVEYSDNKTPVIIICPAHGEFPQRPGDHLTTQGCKSCGVEARAERLRLGKGGFEKKANTLHKNFYDYSKVSYVNNTTKIEIGCPHHGTFFQTPMAHLMENRIPCPGCSSSVSVSQAQKDIAAFVESFYNGPLLVNDRSLLKGKEVDIFLPDLNVAIEYNGVYWHSASRVGKNYHADKTKACQKEGVRLLHIWSDDWTFRKEIVKRHIKAVLQLSSERKVYARKCQVKEITTQVAKTFLEENHIQGYSPSTHKFGLFEEDALVAVATFRSDSSDRENYVLTRYATKHQVLGGHSKLVTFFERHFSYRELVTFADLSFSDGNLYARTGWKQAGFLYPDYSYVVNKKREHKFGYRLKRFREDSNLLFEEGCTESELAALNSIEKIYDCGKLRFVKPHPSR